MDFEVPPWAPKVSWLLHFAFTSWALLSPFIPVQTYFYSQLVFLGVGMWILWDKDSADAAFLFFFTILITIVNDVIVLSIYSPRGFDTIEDVSWVHQVDKNSFRFALVMCIANLMLKPFTATLMLKRYQDNGGRFSISSNNNNSNNSSYGGNPGGYESNQPYQNLDDGRPTTRAPDTQSEHQYVDLQDDSRDRAPPDLPARNKAQTGGGYTQGSEDRTSPPKG